MRLYWKGMAVVLVLALSGCGGGGKNPVTPTQIPLFPSISCVQEELFGGNSTQCRMKVQEDVELLSFRWSDSCGGTFSNKKDDWVTYTAPSVGAKTRCTITATTSLGESASKTIIVEQGSSIPDEKLNVVTDSEASPMKLSSTDGNQFTFTSTGVGETPDIEPGEFLVGTEQGGYLKKVTSVSEKNGTITVTTQDAALDEVIENGSFNESFPFSDSAFTGKLAGVKDLSVGKTIVVSLNNTTLYNSDGIRLSIPEGQITFTPTLNLEGEIAFFELKRFQFFASGDLQVEATLHAETPSGFNKTFRVPIARFDQPFAFAIGPVPVVGVASLVFEAGINLRANGHASATLPTSTSAYVKMGAEYNDGSWSPIADKNFSFTAGSPVIDADANMAARLFVEPRVEVRFYSVAGPYLNLVPYGELNADVTSRFINWKILVGAYSDVGVKVQVLSFKLADYNTRLFEVSQTLKTGSLDIVNDPPVVTISAPSSNSVFAVGDAVTFTGSATDPEDGALSGSSLVWSSSRDGFLGTGESFSTNSLSAGTHTITLTATDKEGLTGEASVVVVISETANRAPTASLSADKTSVSGDLPVSFTVGYTDPEGASGTYLLDFGDGANSYGTLASGQSKIVKHLYSCSSSRCTYTATLTVTDDQGASNKASLEITVVPNQPPVVTISSPADGAIFYEGQTITFLGSAVDPEDGVLNDTTFVWSSSLEGQIGTGSRFSYDGLGVNTHKITLTAKDSKGAIGSASINITILPNNGEGGVEVIFKKKRRGGK